MRPLTVVNKYTEMLYRAWVLKTHGYDYKSVDISSTDITGCVLSKNIDNQMMAKLFLVHLEIKNTDMSIIDDLRNVFHTLELSTRHILKVDIKNRVIEYECPLTYISHVRTDDENAFGFTIKHRYPSTGSVYIVDTTTITNDHAQNAINYLFARFIQRKSTEVTTLRILVSDDTSLVLKDTPYIIRVQIVTVDYIDAFHQVDIQSSLIDELELCTLASIDTINSSPIQYEVASSRTPVRYNIQDYKRLYAASTFERRFLK